jgi:hypothetical protein
LRLIYFDFRALRPRRTPASAWGRIWRSCIRFIFTTKPIGQGTGLSLSMAYGFLPNNPVLISVSIRSLARARPYGSKCRDMKAKKRPVRLEITRLQYRPRLQGLPWWRMMNQTCARWSQRCRRYWATPPMSGMRGSKKCIVWINTMPGRMPTARHFPSDRVWPGSGCL